MNTYKRMKKDHDFVSRIFICLLAFLLIFGAVSQMLMTGTPEAHAASVTSWQELRAAVTSGETEIEITLDGDFRYNGESVKILEGKSVTINGSGTIYSAKRDKYDSMFSVESGGSLTIDSGVTLSAKMGDSGQTCPDGNGGRPTYTKDNFTGGLDNPDAPKDYVPKGFFIHVGKGGQATLKGTVSDFVTSRDKAKTPRYVAPIVANGENAVFNLSGGTIKNNLVGYIVDDSQANKDAQSIKQYIKGAGPNVPRVPQASAQKENKESFDRPRAKDARIDGGLPGTGITATAGAVIYKGGASGTISGGTIKNNRADTGGVMVSGKGTSVKIEDGTISQNVGAQFGGGSTVEQGGAIEMTGGKMEENVAWFGGGAVYATENGVAWLLGLMNGDDGLHPQFDDRLDGRFFMNGGSLNNNTALTRGGAILADSDAVDIKKGALKDNMARMLGGAVYVMGDHPKYTYTMYLTGLYVHDNVAVSGIPQARESAANGPSSKYNKNKLDEFNAKLQRTLLAPSACGDAASDVWGDVFNTPNSDDMNDGWGTHGTGGGVWLCAYGTTYFNAGATSQVVIAKNYATGAVPLNPYDYPRWIRNSSDGKTIREDIAYNTASSVATGTGRTGGNDLHADTGSSGSVIIKNESHYPGWIDENASTSSPVPYNLPVSEDRVNIVNNGEAQEMPAENVQVEVSGNVSRRGGGLAANGTFMLGMRDDQANVESAVDIKKAWHATAEKKPVSIRVSAVQGTNKAVIADVPLDGEANAPVSEYDSVEELAPTGSTWNGRFKLPIEITGSEGKITVFTLILKDEYRKPEDPDGVIDPTTLQGRVKLAEAIKSIKEKYKNPDTGEIDEEAALKEINSAISIKFSQGLKLSCKEYEMVYDEDAGKWTIKTEGGEPVESTSYIFTSKDVDLSEAVFDLQSTSFYGEEYNEETGKMEPVEIYQVHVFGIELDLDAQNDNKPVTEKYVNKEVHSDIVNFDQDFEYDIMAYVPLTAEEFTISDTLVEGLQFAGPSGNANNDPNQVVRAVSVKTINNHLPGEDGTVSGPGEPDSDGKRINLMPGNTPVLPGERSINVNTVLNISGSTLTVRVPAGDTLDLLKGKWVQVTFGARIKDEYRNLEALKALEAGVSGKDKSWEGKKTNKKGDPAYEYLVANGDKAIVAPILSEVGQDPVIWAVEAPSRLFARTSRGDYYATPMDDKTGDTWKLLDKDLDDGDDSGYGKPVWINADNRYYSRAPHASNTRRAIGLDDGELDALKEMPLVKGSTIEKAAEGATRYFALVTDAEGGGHIWATNKGELDSLSWNEVTDKSSDEYIQAMGRLSNDRYTIRMLDLDSDTIALDPDSEEGMNWPVISSEEHEGMANQGSYSVKFGNNAEAKTYKTNTVTVAPETTELDVEKIWNGAVDGMWPADSVTFSIYKVARNNSLTPVYVDREGKVVGAFSSDEEAPAGSKKLTVELTKDKPSLTVTGLPRLKFTAYTARETKIKIDGKEYDVTYDENGKPETVTIDDDEEIKADLTASYQDEGALFESLRDKKNKKVVRGAIADDRLWGMSLDGKYYYTSEGDTEGEGEWEEIPVPKTGETDKTKTEPYDRAKALLGSIDSNGRIKGGTAAEDDIVLIKILPLITAKNERIKYMDLEAAKKWEGATMDEIPSAEDFKSFLVLKNSEGEDVSEAYMDNLEVTAKGISYTAKWSRIPEDDYTVTEKPVPGYDTKTGPDGVITNTKKPEEEKPEIEKYVNQAVHKDIDLSEVFTYDIIAYVTKDADSVTITDKLHDMLAFSGDPASVKVVDLGEANNHKVTNSIENVKVNDNATVASDGKEVEGAEIDISGKTLKVHITNKLKKVEVPGTEEGTTEEAEGYEYDGDIQPVTALRGHWIKVTFKAKIDGRTLEEVKKAYETVSAAKVDEGRDPENKGNAPVVSTDDHTGLPNDASYTIGVANETGIVGDVYKDRSNVVTVKPKEPTEDKKETPKEDKGEEVKPEDKGEDVTPEKTEEKKKKKDDKKSDTGSGNDSDDKPDNNAGKDSDKKPVNKAADKPAKEGVATGDSAITLYLSVLGLIAALTLLILARKRMDK